MSPTFEGPLGDLHGRVLRGDQLALNQLAQHLLQALSGRLRRSFPRAPADLIATAAEDAILEYARRPGLFDPTRGIPVDRFLQRAASRNLTNLLQSERRRQAREAKYAEFAISQVNRGQHTCHDREPSEARGLILSIVTREAEREALLLLLDGERARAVAAALGLANCSLAEQRREIKRFKDRIIKRLIRGLGKGVPVKRVSAARQVAEVEFRQAARKYIRRQREPTGKPRS